MFPFNEGGGYDLSFEASGNVEGEEAQDLILDNELLAAVNLYTSTTSCDAATISFSSIPTTTHQLTPVGRGKGRARGLGRGRRARGDGGRSGIDEDDKRKLQHRDIERLRRQEMSALFSNLRSLLPLEYLKGKRSMSDHIAESANYIKHLQERIKELGDTRDLLRRPPLQHESSSSAAGATHALGEEGSSHHSTTIPNNVEVFRVTNGLHVHISCNRAEDRPRLSAVLKVLLQAGLDVVSCFTNKVDGGLLHNIHCQATDTGRGETDLQQLQQRLFQVVCSYT